MTRLALYQPTRDLENFWSNFDRTFSPYWPKETRTQQIEFGALETEETDTAFTLHFDVPGVKKEDLKIEILGDVLAVSGERQDRKKAENAKYSFSKRLSLPQAIVENQIMAKLEDGVLTLTLPKAPEAKARAIPIN